MSTLLLRLAAPLQAWGADSKFETRRSGREPSKSGVVGLLAAALGLPRGADLSRLNSLRFGVRADREGSLLRDYHTASIDGEKTDYITNRYYLTDAAFLVGLESEDTAFLLELEQALKHPVFPLFLGRRACPPTLPLVRGVRQAGLEACLEGEPLVTTQGIPRTQRKDDAPQTLRVKLDCAPDDADAALLGDLPLSFSPERRRYGIRAAKEYLLTMPQAAAPDTKS